MYQVSSSVDYFEPQEFYHRVEIPVVMQQGQAVMDTERSDHYVDGLPYLAHFLCNRLQLVALSRAKTCPPIGIKGKRRRWFFEIPEALPSG